MIVQALMNVGFISIYHVIVNSSTVPGLMCDTESKGPLFFKSTAQKNFLATGLLHTHPHTHACMHACMHTHTHTSQQKMSTLHQKSFISKIYHSLAMTVSAKYTCILMTLLQYHKARNLVLIMLKYCTFNLVCFHDTKN